MADERKVLLNPILRLVTTPETFGITGRDKDAAKIIPAVYRARQSALLRQIELIRASPATKRATHAGSVLLWAGMDAMSQATSHTPDDLFHSVECKLACAWRNGYVVEAPLHAFNALADRVRTPKTDPQRCDIFRIERFELFATVLVEAERRSNAWDSAVSDRTDRRLFNIHLPPFSDEDARGSVVETLIGAAGDGAIALSAYTARLRIGGGSDGEDTLSGWLPTNLVTEALPRFEPGDILSFGIQARESLQGLIASGAIVRWEPVAPIAATMPGLGREPDPELPAIGDEPVIGVIDGGYQGRRYEGAVEWRHEPVLVPDALADARHGQLVTAVAVDGHLWSNQLELPALYCRVGIVQAVPRSDAGHIIPDQAVLDHIGAAFASRPDTHVWNLSANSPKQRHDFEVSALGHGLSQLAREHEKLLVISAGNKSDTDLISPPADCEAALVVGGRAQSDEGRPAGPCDISRTGFGPEGMLKPETSWFTHHRVLGGGYDQGTSYAAPLVSRLAAHTWRNLSEPTPDMVRALLINACDLDEFDVARGFGSPVNPQLPWVCGDNVAVVAWSASIKALRRHYWTGIRVPPSLLHNGKFRGKAKLVVIHDPVIQIDGHHYVSTRVEAALQYVKLDKDGLEYNESLVGCRNPNARELDAREMDHKWDPVRVYSQSFPKGVALLGDQPTLQVYVRMFWRNPFLYTDIDMRNREARLTVVVALEALDPTADTYNEFRRIMADNVESAVVEQDVTIDVGEG